MPPAPHAPAPLWVGGLADIPDGGDGYKPRQPERRPHPAAGTQLGELVAPARSAHDAMQGVGHHAMMAHQHRSLGQAASLNRA